jgi:glycosyltransferase involved in cell wall biosynthesis
MRIALVHTDLRIYWPPRLLALGKSLQERGDEFFVVEIAGSGSPYDFAPQVRARGELAWSVLFPDGDLRQMSGRTMAHAVERKLDELQPNIVMAGGIAFPSGAAAVRWARRHCRGAIVFDNVRMKDVPRSSVTECVKRRIYANVDSMLIPAESHVSSYLEWGISRNRMFFGLNTVDNAWYAGHVNRLRTSRAVSQRERDLPKRFFLGVGRHIRQKNWSTCLSAYVLYRERVRENAWGLVLVGDGPERTSLETIVAKQGIPAVHLPGALYGGELLLYYASANALILPSYGETWGLVVNEAMACGLPVLVSNRCGCVETLVHNGMNGWQFSPDRPEELAECMLQMSGLSEEEHSRMARASEGIISAWGLDRFVEGAMAAIDSCRRVNRGFASPLDRVLISLWNGRFRPT